VSRKKPKRSDRPAEAHGPRRRWRPGVRTFRVAAVLAVVAGAGTGLHLLRAHVLADADEPERRACLQWARNPEDLPPDIPARVLAELQAGVEGRGVFDGELARDVYERAAGHPWIASVRQVTKRHDGSVVVEAEFRRPFALAAAESAPGKFHVVDSHGVVLPLAPGRVRPGAFIAIDGVGTPPPAPGQVWTAPDLTDGLRLCAMLRGRTWANQVTTIDVRNHNGRQDEFDSHIQLYAQVGQGRRTRVLFGRFPAADGLDYCLTPQEKLAKLDAFVQSNGGVLAGVRDWVDVRHDQVYESLN
jgi:hypothetical protein